MKIFNQVSGATLVSLMDGVSKSVKGFLIDAYRGYSAEIQTAAWAKVAPLIKDHPLNDLTTAALNAEPRLKDVRTSITFDSSNWTGQGFKGFTKPEIEVRAKIVDGIEEDKKNDAMRRALNTTFPSEFNI